MLLRNKLKLLKVNASLLLVCALLSLSYPSYLLVKANIGQWLLGHAWQQAQVNDRDRLFEKRGRRLFSSGRLVNDNFKLGTVNPSIANASIDKFDISQPVNIKPWPWADVYPVAELINHKTNKSYVVLNNDSGSALAFGPGLHGISMYQNHYVVISGHNDSHFSWLENLKRLDVLSVNRLHFGRVDYQVTHTEVIDLQRQNIIIELPEENDDSSEEQTAQHKQLLMITCYPFHGVESNRTLRYLVYAQAVK